MVQRPASMSKEASQWLAARAAEPMQDWSHLPIEEVRARTRQALQPAIDLVLAETGVRSTLIEVAGIKCLKLEPPNADQERLILYAFGGGFTLGSPQEDIPISARFAVNTDAVAIAPVYRLAPENPFPAGLDDVSSVARELLGKNEKVAFVGESAGASLLLSTIHRLRAWNAPMPVAAALMSPATDRHFHDNSFENDLDPSLSRSDIVKNRALYAPNEDLSHPDISPLFGSFDENFPPLILTTGTRDVFLSQSVRLARTLREANAIVDLRVWEGMWHVFEFYPELPEAKASIMEMSEFLNARF